MTTTLPTASDAASRAADAAQFARLGLLAGGQHWLVRLDDASEVVAVGAITPVPLTRPWFCGLSNIRGSLYSVIDLGQFLGGPPTVLTVEARLVLMRGHPVRGDQQLVRRALVRRVNPSRRDRHSNSSPFSGYAPFYIRGEVKKPGEFPYKPGLTLGDAVALAGGYTYRADENKAYVRSAGEGLEIARPLDVDRSVAPGDNIRIPERFF